MLKKTITYETFDGESITEDFYFNLGKADLIELEASMPGGFGEYLKSISASNDGKMIIAAFKDLLKKSYGKRSSDGKRFIKTEEAWEEFTSTDAYDQLFMNLCTDAEAAAEFVNSIIPANLDKDVAKLQANAANISQTTEDIKALSDGPRVLTQAEIVEMDSDELKSGLATGKYVIGT